MIDLQRYIQQNIPLLISKKLLMNTVKLNDGLEVFCLKKTEAFVLDYHVKAYTTHQIKIQKGDIIFDIGANIGLFGVRMMLENAENKIYSFEPIPEIFEVLKANAERYGGGNFKTFQMGVSKEKGETSFTYFPNTPALSTSHPEMWNKPEKFSKAVEGSLRNAPPSMWWTKLIPSFLSSSIARYLKSGSKKITCQLCSVSDMIEEHNIPEISLLKIDCEGGELDVFMGIKDQHWPLIKQVVAEVHNTENRLDFITNMLKGKGFHSIYTEQEDALKGTELFNIYAVRGN